MRFYCAFSTEISLLTVFQLACNQKIVLLTSLEVYTTVLAPQNARHTLDGLWWDNRNKLVHAQHPTRIASYNIIS